MTRFGAFRFFLVALAYLALTAPAAADKRRVFAENSPRTPCEYKDPFVWDDIVLRGTIIRVDRETVPAADWLTPAILQYDTGRPVHILKKVVRVHEMLRGCVNDSLLVLANLDGDDEAETDAWIARITGREVILTAGYKPSPQPAWVQFSSYLRAGRGWTQSWDEDGDTLLESDIRESVSKVSVQRMTREADLVVRATIRSAQDSGDSGGSRPECDVQITKVLKGGAVSKVTLKARGSIDFKDGSQWRSLLGFDLGVGTSWYLFLSRQDDGAFRPTAAWRSAFKIEGDQILERLHTPSCYTPSGLENEILSAMTR